MRIKAPHILLLVSSLLVMASCTSSDAPQTESNDTLPSYQANALVIQEVFHGNQRFRLTGVYGAHRNDETLSWAILVPENLLDTPENPNITNIVEDGDAIQPANTGLDLRDALSVTIHEAHGVISVNNERMRIEPGFTGLILGPDNMVPLDVPPALAIAWLQYYDILVRVQDTSYEPSPGPLWDSVLGPLVSRGVGGR